MFTGGHSDEAHRAATGLEPNGKRMLHARDDSTSNTCINVHLIFECPAVLLLTCSCPA